MNGLSILCKHYNVIHEHCVLANLIFSQFSASVSADFNSFVVPILIECKVKTKFQVRRIMSSLKRCVFGAVVASCSALTVRRGDSGEVSKEGPNTYYASFSIPSLQELVSTKKTVFNHLLLSFIDNGCHNINIK